MVVEWETGSWRRRSRQAPTATLGCRTGAAKTRARSQPGHPGLGQPFHHRGRVVTRDDLIEQLGGIDKERRVDGSQRVHPDEVPRPRRDQPQFGVAFLNELDGRLLIWRGLIAGLDRDRRVQVLDGAGPALDHGSPRHGLGIVGGYPERDWFGVLGRFRRRLVRAATCQGDERTHAQRGELVVDGSWPSPSNDDPRNPLGRGLEAHLPNPGNVRVTAQVRGPTSPRLCG